jgi:hypothetical protein
MLLSNTVSIIASSNRQRITMVRGNVLYEQVYIYVMVKMIENEKNEFIVDFC